MVKVFELMLDTLVEMALEFLLILTVGTEMELDFVLMLDT